METDLKTVVGLFDELSEARDAVHDLSARGFTREEVNLIANASTEEYSRYFNQDGRYVSGDEEAPSEAVAGAVNGVGVGAVLGGLGGLLLGMSLLPIPGVGPIIAAGPLSASLLGAAAGGLVGGLLGALTSLGVPEDHASYYAEGVRRGGTLVIIKTDATRVELATDVLARHFPVDVKQRVARWKGTGWHGYDSNAPLLSLEQVAAERQANATPSR